MRRNPPNTIAIDQVQRLFLGLSGASLQPEELMAEALIPPAFLRVPDARVPADRFAALIRILVRRTRDELFLRGQHRVRPGTFAQACRIMVQARTLGLSVRDGARFLATSMPDVSPRLDVRGGTARIVLREASAWTPALGYTQATVLLFGHGVLSWLIGRRLPLVHLSFRYGAGNSSREFRELFRAPIDFDSKFASMSFDAKWLDLSVVQTRETADRFIKETPGNLVLGFRDRSSLAERTRRNLSAHLPARSLTLEEVAESVGLTPSNFRRKLQAEGDSFQDIKDELRRDLAIQYLGRSDLSLNQVAELLGFSEPSTFNRAFKAWTGMAPGAYRLSECLPTARERGAISQDGVRSFGK